MYAIVEIAGQQMKAEQGRKMYVHRLENAEGETVVFDNVLVYSDKSTKIGTPYVKGATVTTKVEKQGKEKKVIIFKYKAKKGSTRRKQGHRQPYTKLLVEAIAIEA